MENKKILLILLGVLLLCILCACLVIAGYFLIVQDTDLDPFSADPSPTTVVNTADSTVTPLSEQPADTPIPQVPTLDPNQQKWLVMLYQDGDDQTLEYSLLFDANEAEYAGSNERVTIVSQIDRYLGAYTGDGDWTSAKRFYITVDQDLYNLRSQEIMDLGEIDMGQASTLVDFVLWAINSYEADRYVLILSDHGAGWHGGWSDGDNANTNGLLMREIDAALGEIVERSGIEKLDILGFDACLMGQLESLSMVQPHARIAIASEEVIPSIGLAYHGFLSALMQNPAMSPEDLARTMVSTYIDRDLQIVDDDARREYVAAAYDYTGETTPEEVAAEIGIDVTLSAVNLEALPFLNSALNALVYEMTFIDQNTVSRARTYAQSYYNLYGPDAPPSFIDLGNFVELLMTETGSSNISTAANRLFAALDEVMIDERHGPERPGSTGISIYFPNSMLYQSDFAGYDAYNHSVDRFVEDWQWDDFLAFHYFGTAFEPDYAGPVIPAPGAQMQNPGVGNIEISPLITSSETIGQGESLHIETRISGENIGYIYFFAGKYFEESGTYLAIDSDYIASNTTREVNGVYYPDWGGGPVDISIDRTLSTYFISNGERSEFAVLYPLEYGASPEQNIYAVDGLYTFGESGEQTYAVMTFGSDGLMIEVYSFQPQGGGGPREILPRQGDSFSPLLKAIALPDDPDAEPEFVEFQGGTLTFGNTIFTWGDASAEPGQYVVGVGVLDLDGNYNLSFVPVKIE